MPAPRLRPANPFAAITSRLSDAELVQRAQASRPGKEAAGVQAVCELYDRYQKGIFRYLGSRLADRQTAEDLTGEVFTRMVAALAHYRADQAPFAAWLYRIARNLLVDHYRKDGGAREQLPLDEMEWLGTREGDPAGEIEGRMFVEQVRKSLHRLQPAEQEAIVLRFFIGLSLRETAQILGKTEGAVKIAQHRGLSQLRRLLNGEAAEEKTDG